MQFATLWGWGVIMIRVAIADDHQLVAKAISGLIQKLENYEVIYEVENGKELIQHFKLKMIPDIVLLDINMPEMDGYETASWLKENHPEIKVLALTMYDNENAIIRMLNCGAKGYILKDSDPDELELAIDSMMAKGHYYTEMVNNKLLIALGKQEEEKNELKILLNLNDKEKHFLELCCTELTYKEIAEKMFISHRTVDNYRDVLFEKLHLKTRVGLVMFAIKNGIVTI